MNYRRLPRDAGAHWATENEASTGSIGPDA